MQRSSEIAERGEIMRQSLEGLSTAIERFINLLEVRGARPHRLHSRLCHHAHTRQHKNQLLATAWINRSVNSCLASLVCTPRRELRVCLQVNPRVRVRIQIFGEISSKEKFESCSANTHTIHDLLSPQCHVAQCTELKPFTQ